MTIDATKSNYNPKTGLWYVGDAFNGSTVNSDGTTTASQTVNPGMMEKQDAMYEMDAGTTMLHETLEAYIGGVETPGTGIPTMDITQQEYKNYENAHTKAMQADPRFKEPFISVDQNAIYINKFDPLVVPMPLNKEELINDLSK